ncbi:MAG: hypothetical protein ABSC94_07415 [Polyangiaceae bacterium]|jgi:hypothetical protein
MPEYHSPYAPQILLVATAVEMTQPFFWAFVWGNGNVPVGAAPSSNVQAADAVDVELTVLEPVPGPVLELLCEPEVDDRPEPLSVPPVAVVPVLVCDEIVPVDEAVLVAAAQPANPPNAKNAKEAKQTD